MKQDLGWTERHLLDTHNQCTVAVTIVVIIDDDRVQLRESLF